MPQTPERHNLTTSINRLQATLVKSERLLNPELHLSVLTHPLRHEQLYDQAVNALDALTAQIEQATQKELNSREKPRMPGS